MNRTVSTSHTLVNVNLKSPCFFKLKKKTVSAFRDKKGTSVLRGRTLYLQYTVQAPCRFRICTLRGRIETRILCNNFSSSYTPYRCMPLAIRPLTINTVKYSYPPCKDFPCPYTVKKVNDFPAPAGMPLTKLSLAGNNLIFPVMHECCTRTYAMMIVIYAIAFHKSNRVQQPRKKITSHNIDLQ